MPAVSSIIGLMHHEINPSSPVTPIMRNTMLKVRKQKPGQGEKLPFLLDFSIRYLNVYTNCYKKEIEEILSVSFDPLFLSRVQFALTVSFHILFPSITIGLSVWLAALEGLHLATGNALYRRLFDLWLKIFAVLFAMGVVSGIVMAFQFGTNWSAMSAKIGPIMGPLLGYEAFTAFALEATFLGLVLYARNRVAPWFYFFSCCMIAFGTVLSSFWILCNNSWMQVPVGHAIMNGRIIPSDWAAIVLGPVFLVRWLHMLTASFLTTAMCLIAAGAWYLLRNVHLPEARVMMNWGLGLTAVLAVLQLVIGDISGKHMYRYQPAKFAAIEARWHPEHPGTEVWFAIPDVKNKRNLLAVETPKVGSWIATGSWTAPVSGLSDFPEKDWPPILIPFFTFRIMVGIGLLMIAIGWSGLLLRLMGKLETFRWYLWGTILAFPVGFAAVIIGWFTSEVGRQPWTVYGLLRTADSVTPTLTTGGVLFTLLCYVAIYTVIFLFGLYYIYGMLREGPVGAGPEAAGIITVKE
jgi:cytochrome d ubiquinol oxidase subunit I